MELAKRKQNRLPEYDYSLPNAYFITICTANRKQLFWENNNATVNKQEDISLSKYGKIVYRCIGNIQNRYPMISVDHFAIMPNHVHLLLQINTAPDGRPMAAPTISTVINQTKGAVSRQVGFSLWQKGFYDHVIRGDRDYQEIWTYIEGNPSKWFEDELFAQE